MQLVLFNRRMGLVLVAAAMLGLGGCGNRIGSFDSVDGGGDSQEHGWSSPVASKLMSLLNFSNDKDKKDDAQPATDHRHVDCPEVIVFDGTAARRVYVGGAQTNESLRYQLSLDDSARECRLEGEEIAIKVGVQGKVLLGPAGSPGSFTVPIHIVIMNEADNKLVITKVYRANVTIPSGQSEGGYTVISEVMHVPFIQEHANQDYTIRAAIDEGEGAEAVPSPKRRRGRSAASTE